MERGARCFDHMTVVVTELDEARRFFELLGFEESQAVVVSGDEMSRYMGIPDWKADHVTLVLPHAVPRQEVQLLRFHHPPPVVDAQSGYPARTGFNHVCFRVEDLAATLARFEAEGFAAKNEVMTFHDRRLVFLDGPAGVTVELAEWFVG